MYDVEHEWEEHEDGLVRSLDSLAGALEGHVAITVHAMDAALVFLRDEYRRQPGRLEQQVDLVTRSFPDEAITQVAVIGPDGMLAYTNFQAAATPMYLGDRTHFKVHRDSRDDRIYISEPVFGRVSKKWTLQFTRKLLRADGSFGGVLVISLDIKYFNRFYDSLKLGSRGVITLIGADGIIRSRSAKQDEALGLELSNFPPLLPGAKPQGYFLRRSQVDQVVRLFTYRKLEGIPLVVVVGISEKEAFAPIARQQAEYYWGAAIASAGIIAFVAILLAGTRRQYIAEARYRHILHHASEGMMVCDRGGTIREVNGAACRMHGYSEAELVGLPVSAIEVAPGGAGSSLQGPIGAAITYVGREGEHQRQDGSRFPVETSMSTVPGDDSLVFLVIRDITERKEQLERIWRQANFDSLTGLPNRTLFYDRLMVAIAQVKRYGGHIAVLFLDLDRFKWINDTLGHDAGDEVLVAVADRLRSCLRDGDTLARLGGDEFCLLLPNIPRKDMAEGVAAKILNALGPPLSVHGQEVCISCSIGIALYPDDGEDQASLMKHADAAMYLAKERGRNRYACYGAGESTAAPLLTSAAS